MDFKSKGREMCGECKTLGQGRAHMKTISSDLFTSTVTSDMLELAGVPSFDNSMTKEANAYLPNYLLLTN